MKELLLVSVPAGVSLLFLGGNGDDACSRGFYKYGRMSPKQDLSPALKNRAW